jgi:hypothetical protein
MGREGRGRKGGETGKGERGKQKGGEAGRRVYSGPPSTKTYNSAYV